VNSTATAAQLLQIRLRLRPELRCRLQTLGRESYYQIEDPLTRRFYRLGRREWELARRMNGQSTLGEILEQLQRLATRDVADRSEGGLGSDEAVPITGPAAVLFPADAVKLARWLVQSQLATVSGRLTHPMLIRSPRPRATPAWLNPAFMRVPLFNPDALLTRMLPWLSWTLRPEAVVVWCAVMLAALYQVGTRWSRFTAPIATILAPGNWFYLLLAWIALKAVHELYHGLVCKRYGGQVPVCGIALILFSPVAFVDVTSTWRFRAKWHRVYTAAGGMYAELFVAAILTLVWARTDSAWMSQICHNVILMASVSTMLFNGNFLMRFDGYYIFSDLLNLQNLYGRGQQYVRGLARRHLLGLRSESHLAGGIKGTVVKIYGVASLVWRLVFYVGIVLTAATMFRGAGIIISLLIGTLWIVMPTAKFVVYVANYRGAEQPNRRRFAIICSSGLVAAALLCCLPWPGGVVTTGVVDYEPIASIRTETPGFVQTLHVNSGQSVQPGTPLASITNPETETELSGVEFSARQAEIRARMLQDEDDVSGYQVEKKHLESLTEQQRELAQKVAALQLSAPMHGRVIGRDLHRLQGQYVAAGTEILAIGDDAQKSILVAVPQKDIDFFLKQLGTRPRVRVAGRGRLTGAAVLVKVDPRASQQLPHPALAAANGGPLPVTVGSDESAAAEVPSARLVEPHFRATIALSAEQACELRAGELARVRLTSRGESVGGHLWSVVDAWIRYKLKPRAG
jgi:putative peptide zinc metalloprotease protein